MAVSGGLYQDDFDSRCQLHRLKILNEWKSLQEDGGAFNFSESVCAEKLSKYHVLLHLYEELLELLKYSSSKGLKSKEKLCYVFCIAVIAESQTNNYEKTKGLLRALLKLEEITHPDILAQRHLNLLRQRIFTKLGFGISVINDGVPSIELKEGNDFQKSAGATLTSKYYLCPNVKSEYKMTSKRLLADVKTEVFSEASIYESSTESAEAYRQVLLIADVFAELANYPLGSLEAKLIKGQIELAVGDNRYYKAAVVTLKQAVSRAVNYLAYKQEAEARLNYARALYKTLPKTQVDKPVCKQLKEHLEDSVERIAFLKKQDSSQGQRLRDGLIKFYQEIYSEMFAGLKPLPNRSNAEKKNVCTKVVVLATHFRLMSERKVHSGPIMASYDLYSSLPEVVECRELAKLLSAYASCLMGVYPDLRPDKEDDDERGLDDEARDYFSQARDSLKSAIYLPEFSQTETTYRFAQGDLLTCIRQHLKEVKTNAQSPGKHSLENEIPHQFSSDARSPSMEELLSNQGAQEQAKQKLQELIHGIEQSHGAQHKSEETPEAESSLLQETLNLLENINQCLFASVKATPISPPQRKSIFGVGSRLASKVRDSISAKPAPASGSLVSPVAKFSRENSQSEIGIGVSKQQVIVEAFR